MAEYIEREALYEKAYWHGEHPDVGNPFPDGVDAIDIEDVDAIPAADVAPVVRCRDCKHAWIHPCGYVYCHRDGRHSYEMTFNLDSFCSYGERKDNG